MERAASLLAGVGEAEYRDGVLSLHHEGQLDYEELLAGLLDALGGSAEGGMDVIDRDEWTMTRYTVEAGDARSKVVPLNEALEGKCAEWGA